MKNTLKNRIIELIESEKFFIGIITKLIKFMESEIKSIENSHQPFSTPTLIKQLKYQESLERPINDPELKRLKELKKHLNEPNLLKKLKDIVMDLKVFITPLNDAINLDNEDQSIVDLYKSFSSGQFEKRLQQFKKITIDFEREIQPKLQLLYMRSSDESKSSLHQQNNIEANISVLFQRSLKYPLFIKEIKPLKRNSKELEKLENLIDYQTKCANETKRIIEDAHIGHVDLNYYKYKIYNSSHQTPNNFDFNFIETLLENSDIFSRKDLKTQQEILNLLFIDYIKLPANISQFDKIDQLIKQSFTLSSNPFPTPDKDSICSSFAKGVIDRLQEVTTLSYSTQTKLTALLMRVFTRFALDYRHESIIDYLVEKIKPALYRKDSSFDIYFENNLLSFLNCRKAISERKLMNWVTDYCNYGIVLSFGLN